MALVVPAGIHVLRKLRDTRAPARVAEAGFSLCTASRHPLPWVPPITEFTPEPNYVTIRSFL